MDHISVDSLRGNLSFLASDLLEGRATPSRGLDLAGEYIAAQFRRAGLEPAGDDGYFQTASVNVREPNREGFKMTVTAGGRTISIEAEEAYVLSTAPLQLSDAELVVADGSRTLTVDAVNGKVLLITTPRVRLPQGARPAVVLTLAGRARRDLPPVVNPYAPPPAFATGVIAKPELLDFLRGLDRRPDHSAILQPQSITPVKVRNVAAILRGSDPQLRDTYVILSSHYDHLGMAASGDDRIFNGANDDGSGSASVMEVASALAALPVHPKRSILFILFLAKSGVCGDRAIMHPSTGTASPNHRAIKPGTGRPHGRFRGSAGQDRHRSPATISPIFPIFSRMRRKPPAFVCTNTPKIATSISAAATISLWPI